MHSPCQKASLQRWLRSGRLGEGQIGETGQQVTWEVLRVRMFPLWAEWTVILPSAQHVGLGAGLGREKIVNSEQKARAAWHPGVRSRAIHTQV